MALSYSTLDKFDRIICAFNNRGWTRIDSNNDANFIFTNLIKINFDELNEETYINHLKGSQHLSNKSYLSYHVKTSGFDSWMPPQWSAAYEDLISLLGMILLDSLYSLMKGVIRSEIGLSEISAITLPYKQMMQVFEKKKSLYVDIIESERILAVLENPTPSMCNDLITSIEEKYSWQRCGGCKNIWIIKPVGLSCGENIIVAKGMKQVCQALRDMHYKCVVQKYIEHPLLVRTNRKFDIRQWILVTSVNPLVIHGFNECYLRLSSQEYTVDESKLSDAKIHLCNHAIQRDGHTHSPGSSSLEFDTMMTQSQFNDELVPPDLADDKTTDPFSMIIKPKIKQISIDTIKSVRDKLCKVGRGFEWLGLDLIVTETLDVLLLEVNVSPDISLSTPITSRLVDPAISDLLRVVVDKSELVFQNALHWEPWHVGSRESFQEIREFARRKAEKGTIQKDYLPRNLDVAQGIFNIVDGVPPSVDEDEDEF